MVVRALGWHAELSALKDLKVDMDEVGKYPLLDACFRAQDDLYFAGSITHGFDKHRFGSAGGFIHGFRYTVRSLFRCLLQKYEGLGFWQGARKNFTWHPEAQTAKTMSESPGSSPWKLRLNLEQTPHWSHLLRRINEASGPYQMSCGALVDGIVYRSGAGQAEYIEDVPLDLFEAEFGDFPRLLFQYRYGTREDINNAGALRSRLVAFASNFLHPVLFFMLPGHSLQKSSRLHLVEDRWTDFAGREAGGAPFMQHVDPIVLSDLLCVFLKFLF